MEAFLNKKADGTAGPVAKWYAVAHALRCSRCRKYLEALEAMLERLSRERESRLPAQVQSRLEQSLAVAATQVEG
jgi:hypothetical protein